MRMVSDLVARVKANMPLDVQGRYDWDAIDHKQGNYDLQVMVFLWSKADVSVWDRKRSHTLLTKELVDKPLAVRGPNARLMWEISPDKALVQSPSHLFGDTWY